jgi:GNAT superfamily N-acetyltransferase
VELTIRPAGPNDLVVCYEVWLANEHYDGAAVPSGTVLPLHTHELHSGRLIVAETQGRVIGFAAALERSGVVYLSGLFVAPAHHGLGVGRKLLTALLGEHRGGLFTFASSDPAARHLYEHFGMSGHWELLYLEGHVERIDLASFDPAGIVAEPTTLTAVGALDRQVTGRDRHLDLAHDCDRLRGQIVRLARSNQTVGHAVVIHPQWWVPWRPNGTRVAPIVVADTADAAAATAAAVLHAVAVGARSITTFVPAPHPGLPSLLAAGFEVSDADLYMATDATLIDPARYLPAIDTA